ncbi:MAG: right-handed parallel beta-helix repeat-containing protein [Candidatus Thorarchaeota archaeon]
MRSRVFAMSIVIVLMIQPFIIIGTIMQPESRPVIQEKSTSSQEPGTRLEPDEHTAHVPILIDEESDFEAQGWPGSGTESSPYVISDLNITYNVDQVLIRVYNTDSYFVIKDCYLGQLSARRAIHLENVTNADIEFVTVSSAGDGINAVNANASTISHVDAHAESSFSMEITQSANIEIESNTLSGYGLYLRDSSGIHAHDNEIIDTTGLGALVLRSNGTIFQSNAIKDTTGYGLQLDNSSLCDIDANHIENTGFDGIYYRLSENVTIVDNEIIESGSSGINFVSYEWTSIIGNIINNSNAFPIETWDPTNGIISENELLNSPTHSGIAFHSSAENFTITENYIENFWNGVYFVSGSEIEVSRNTIIDVDNYFIYHQSIPNGSVVNNTCVNSARSGIYAFNSPGTNISGNVINNTGNRAIYTNSANLTISSNTMYDNAVGIQTLFDADNIETHDNQIELADVGIRVSGDDATVDSNDIYNCQIGIEIAGSANEAEISNNQIIDVEDKGIYVTNANTSLVANTIANAYTGVFVEDASSPTLENNTIHSSTIGIHIVTSSGGLFENNNMTDCGLYFPSGQSIANLNHTFIGNHVNAKPLFYALSESGLTLDGNEYGQIILVNCSDSSVNGGEFTRSTSSFQVYHSERVEISSIHVVDQWHAMSIYESVNLTIADSVFEGTSDNDAITANYADGFTADNVTLTDINGIGIYVQNANPSVVKNSHFENIADSAVSFYAVDDGVIQGNELINATRGLHLQYTINTLIDDNHLMWNTYGIHSSLESDNNNATFNNIHDNQYGIRMDDCWSWFIYNNSIRWNSEGLYITNTNNDQWIYNNTFALNTVHNGYDTGDDDWDDRVDGGNYWSDYSGSGVYNIPGGISMDRWPYKYIVTEPEINNPKDVWYAEGSEGNEIVWFPIDDNLRDWTFEIGDYVRDSGPWNFDNITVNIDGLNYGVHQAKITVRDLDGNNVTDTVMIHVYDDTPPQINHLPNRIAFVDGTDQTLSYEVSDLNPATYHVYVDDSEFEEGSWTSGTLEVDIDGFEAGIHEFRIVIKDDDGNEATDTVEVRFIDDDQGPTIDSPPDIMYVQDTTGNSIVWSPSDEYPDHYIITSNDSVLVEGSWGGSRIALNVDGLDVGTHEFTLTVFDGSGLTASDSVNVTVLPTQPTSPQQPVDLLTILIIGAAIGGAVLVIAGVLYYRREKQ